MTLLTVQNGALVLRGTSLGTGQGCCCGDGGEPCDPCASFSGGVARGWVLRGEFFAPGTWVSPSSGFGGVFAYTAPDVWVPEFAFPEPYWLLIRSENGTLYDCNGPFTPVEGDQKDDTIIANPPPDDGQWYEGVYIDGRVAWYLACEVRPCTLEFEGAGGGVLVIDSFSFLGSPCEEAICCNGNDAVPTLAAPGACGHSQVVFGGPPGTPQAQCLGACCHDPGTGTECMEPQTLDGCDALGGTWHSGEVCAADPCNLFP